MILRATFFALALASMATGIASAQPVEQTAPGGDAAPALDPVVVEAAHRMVTAAHLEETMLGVMDQLIPIMVGQLSEVRGVSAADRETLVRVVIEEVHRDPGPLVDMVARSYARHLSVDDLNGISDFYESPAGQHMLAAQPAMQAELLAVSQEWGRTVLGPRLLQRFEEMKAHPPSHS